ncbi:MAG: hypothetical protein AAF602_08680 [Myxococcota bacterium]
MVARTTSAVTPPDPDEDDLAMPVEGARWAAARLHDHGLGLAAALRDDDGTWRPCDLTELFAGGSIASIGQRPSCGGMVTTVHVWDDEGIRGAFWLERGPGGNETPLFRVVLLQALLRPLDGA